MKKVVAVAVLATTLISVMPLPAQANGAVNAALALGAFAVFNQLFLAPVWARPVYVTPSPVVYTTPIYGPPTTYYAPPPPPAIQREVIYPHGRYVLYGDGLTVAYQWVWVPNPPPPPPPSSPPAR